MKKGVFKEKILSGIRFFFYNRVFCIVKDIDLFIVKMILFTFSYRLT